MSPAAGVGIDRPERIPDQVDVLIVGAGPAGMIVAAQLSKFPNITTRIVDRRAGRLEIGRADGIQTRTVETFQAFGFANRIIDEAYRIEAMNFWSPDPAHKSNIIRTSRTEDDPTGISEFPHLIVNQARVLDYFAEYMANAPTRMAPDYGIEFVKLVNTGEGDYPVEVTLRRLDQAGSVIDVADVNDREKAGAPGEEFTVRAKYVVGADGARSGVRQAIGRSLSGAQAYHAWGVLDSVAVTDFPDIHTKCAVSSEHGSILLIPREGGHLFRMYIDLGETAPDASGEIRKTTAEETIARANAILHPYSIDVKHIAWYSVYEVGHRLTDKFDDCTGEENPRVFIMGDACHTHSAKAGQGMNVSMQDGFNLGWKLAEVLEGIADPEILHTYSAERQVVAQNLIDFDREWSSRMAKTPTSDEDTAELGRFYVETMEFMSGFMTEYQQSPIVGTVEHQALATGFPLGRRFKSTRVVRIADAATVHLGHLHEADGRWRVYVFADAAKPGDASSAVSRWADWFEKSPESPRNRFTPKGADENAIFDAKVIYRDSYDTFDTSMVPRAFQPRLEPYGLVDPDAVFGTGRGHDIFEERGIGSEGCVIVVRPDQYVANILPLEATDEFAGFFDGFMREPSEQPAAEAPEA